MTNSIKVNRQRLSIAIRQRTWVIERPSSLEELWNMLAQDAPSPESKTRSAPRNPDEIDLDEIFRGFEEDERIPYWTELWPAGIALASWLDTRYLNQATCLDLGCGLGLSALAGAAAGARVIAMDYEPLALYYAGINSELNQLHIDNGNLSCLAGDWRHICFKQAVFDYIWAGDIMYEKRFMQPVARFVTHCLKPRGSFWIAEPGRGIYPEFAGIMRSRGWSVSIVERTKAGLPGSDAPPADIQIWELKRKTE
ncbi:MAG: methyltransferase domain-containing protein [Desulfovibrionaceae bacterium]|nr:methyltransferase domain-containing protein [Desulfovibrionaceae bacterium]